MNNWIVFIAALAAVVVSQSVSEKNSFAPPFSTFTWSGNRKLNGWTCGGSSSIKAYFIRLTPDRQSKVGYCWNDSPIGASKWVTTVKFRISGQGENLFGDGITIFFTTNESYDSGTMHGTSDLFTGFAIDLSTFKNPDYYRSFRDVSLYVGNSTNEHAFHPESAHPGCYANYRYYEKRQDFSVENAARVQISYSEEDSQVVVQVDSHNSGTYESCMTETVSLPAGWWKNVHIGISASTGDLADNHDIIEVTTITGATSSDKSIEALEDQEREKSQQESLKALLQTEGIDVASLNPQEKALFSVVKELADSQGAQLQKIQREMEHSMTAIDDSINNMLNKLRQRGDVSVVRIDELEKTIQSRVTNSVSSQIHARIVSLENMLDHSLKNEVTKKSRTWVLPFFVLIVVLSVVFYYAYREYVRIKKFN